MGSWDSNGLTIEGSAENLRRFHEEVSAPRPSGLADDAELISQPLSFWNIIQPEDKEAYFVSDDSEFNWNYEHWSSRSDADFEENGSCTLNVRKGYLHYEFDTGEFPHNIAAALAERCKALKLTMSWHYGGMAGEGGRFSLSADCVVTHEEWESPETHEAALRAFDECPCNYEADFDYWYEDCPPHEAAIVEVNRRVEAFISRLIENGAEKEEVEVFRPNEEGIALLRRTSLKIYDRPDPIGLFTAELKIDNHLITVENDGKGESNRYRASEKDQNFLRSLDDLVMEGFPDLDPDEHCVLDHFCLIAEAAGTSAYELKRLAQRKAAATLARELDKAATANDHLGDIEIVSVVQFNEALEARSW